MRSFQRIAFPLGSVVRGMWRGFSRLSVGGSRPENPDVTRGPRFLAVCNVSDARNQRSRTATRAGPLSDYLGRSPRPRNDAARSVAEESTSATIAR